MGYVSITAENFAQLPGLEDWRVVAGTAQAWYRADSFGAAADLVAEIARAADAADHHPDVDLRYPGLIRVGTRTHFTNGLTLTDVELARTVSGLARRAGVQSLVGTPEGVPRTLEIAIDTMDADRIRPFWREVLGYVDHGDELVDPARVGPAVWFQQLTAERPGRGRIHLDVFVPHDVADRRRARALAAGGTLVGDEHAPAWWVLADADGNEVCVCTWQGDPYDPDPAA